MRNLLTTLAYKSEKDLEGRKRGKKSRELRRISEILSCFNKWPKEHSVGQSTKCFKMSYSSFGRRTIHIITGATMRKAFNIFTLNVTCATH